MSTDYEERKDSKRPRLDFIPRILDIKIHIVPYEPPRMKHFKATTAEYSQAIAFDVRTEGRFVERALSPLLLVGDAIIREGGEITTEKNQKEGVAVYRWLAFEPDDLEEGAPITIIWPDSPQKRLRTPFTYKLENKTKNPSLKRQD